MTRTLSARFAVTALVALLSTGCLKDSRITAPASQDGGGSVAMRSESASDARPSTNGDVQYPLTVGNQWKYRSREYSEEGFVGYPVQVLTDLDFKTTLDLTCEERIGDTRYVYERITYIHSDGAESGTGRYWQNPRGLWREFGLQPPAACGDAVTMRAPAPEVSIRNVVQQQVNAAIARSPRRAEIEAAWNRIQAQRRAFERDQTERLLAYPLHPGRTWRISASGTRLTVEALETLHLPVGDVRAWRIRYEVPHQDPRSHYHVWYGDIGMVQSVAHIEERTVYPDGRIDVLTNESEMHLESFRTAERGGLANFGGAPDGTLGR